MATMTEPKSDNADLPVLDYWKSLNPEPLPVRGRELLAVSWLVVLSDLTIYRGQGFAGYALFFVVAPVLLVMSVHPIDAEGLHELWPLMDCHDEIVREGVKALLARREGGMAAEDQRTGREFSHWEQLTAIQFAEEALLRELNSDRDRLKPYSDPAKREEAWERFQKYAYHWY